jgi:hypothetical protein
MPVRTIDWKGCAVEIIDQTALPGELCMETMESVEALISAIRRLAVRGAPALGVAGLARSRAGATRALRHPCHVSFLGWEPGGTAATARRAPLPAGLRGALRSALRRAPRPHRAPFVAGGATTGRSCVRPRLDPLHRADPRFSTFGRGDAVRRRWCPGTTHVCPLGRCAGRCRYEPRCPLGGHASEAQRDRACGALE